MKKKITLDINEEALNLIDKACKEEFCSRTSYIVRNSVKAAKDTLEN